MPAESQEFLSDDDLSSPEGYHSPYSRRLSYDGRVQVDEDDSACVAPLDLHPSADPLMNMPPSYLHRGALEYPVTNSPKLHHTTSTAAGPSDNPTLVSHAGVRLAPRRRRFRCETCQKTFDRPSRLENCRNRHSNSKPHECLGACGSSGWYVVCTIFFCSFRAFMISGLLIPQPSAAKYSSVEYLERHISPTNQCTSWQVYTMPNEYPLTHTQRGKRLEAEHGSPSSLLQRTLVEFFIRCRLEFTVWFLEDVMSLIFIGINEAIALPHVRL
jgi:hypothetical protein